MDDPTAFTDFSGQLSAEGHSWTVALRARVAPDGELELDFSPIERSRETVAISHIFQRQTASPCPFRLIADAADGTRLEAEHLALVGMTSNTADGAIKLRMTCLKGVFSHPRSDIELPVILRGLRALECWRPVRAICRLGEMSVAGAMGSSCDDRVCGQLSLRALEKPQDEAAWLAEAERLLAHVRWILSFAAGIDLKAPTTTTFARNAWRLEVLSQAPTATGGLPVIHPSDLGDIFNAAVTSFFAPPIQAERLYFAIEWFVTPARHKETRLTNAMTALENLVNSNLPEEVTCLLPPKRFAKLARLMRQALKEEAKAALEADKPGASVPTAVQKAREAEEAFRTTLAAKMLDLNRRPLADKIALLLERWAVPARDLSIEAMKAAISARNLVVHEGYYADHLKSGADREDLWAHIFTAREIVERIIMTVVGYKGSYLSFRDGQSTRNFPPVDLRPGLGA